MDNKKEKLPTYDGIVVFDEPVKIKNTDRLILHFEEFVNERCVRRPDSENRNYIPQFQDKGEDMETEEEE